MKCDYCRKKAVCNYQDVIVRYSIKKGEYSNPSLDTDFTAGEAVNKHLCEKHEIEFTEGNLD